MKIPLLSILGRVRVRKTIQLKLEHGTRIAGIFYTRNIVSS